MKEYMWDMYVIQEAAVYLETQYEGIHAFDKGHVFILYIYVYLLIYIVFILISSYHFATEVILHFV